MRTNLVIVMIALVSVVSAKAERVPLSPEDLNKESTHIITGEVKSVYSRDAESDLYGSGTIVTRFIVEIEIKSIEKGDGLKKGEMVYARCWSLKKRGSAGDRPGPSGHFGIPPEGDVVKVYLHHGSYSPTGQGDNGYAVVYPNGFEKLEKPKKK